MFLTKDGKAKLGDLNVSKIAKKGLLYTQTGTPYYASPEVWKDQPYDSKSDIWSLGCVVYEAVTLKPPFRAQSMEALNQRVQKGVYPKIPSIYSEDLSNLIKLLLQVNPKKRPSCDEILRLPIIRKKMEELQLEEDPEKTSLAGNALLGTIQLPKNLRILREKLPKPNYGIKSSPDENEDEPPPSAHIHRNKSTRANQSSAKVLESNLPASGGSVNSNREPQRPTKRPSRVPEPMLAAAAPEPPEKVFRLPDIRKGAPPIRRSPPRVYAQKEERLASYLQNPAARQASGMHGGDPREDRNSRLRRMYDELNKYKAAYYAMPVIHEEKPRGPIIQNVYHNAYHIYQQPVYVRPSWWG